MFGKIVGVIIGFILFVVMVMLMTIFIVNTFMEIPDPKFANCSGAVVIDMRTQKKVCVAVEK